MGSDETLKAELAKAITECERLREENARLRLRIGEAPEGAHQDVERPRSSGEVKAPSSATVTDDSRPDVKLSLFKDLFRVGTTFTRLGGKEGTVLWAIHRPAIRNGTRHLPLGKDQRNHFASPSYFH
jgi:regulator of replication initiation timing